MDGYGYLLIPVTKSRDDIAMAVHCPFPLLSESAFLPCASACSMPVIAVV